MAILEFAAGSLGTSFVQSTGVHSNNGGFATDATYSDGNVSDNEFDTAEGLTRSEEISGVPLGSGPATYLGTVNVGGTDYPVFQVGAFIVVHGISLSSGAAPTFASLGSLDTSNLTVDFCFAAGTQIATPSGEKVVESLQIGDLILRADGTPVPVKWLGHQTRHKIFAGERLQPVRIRAGALGDGVPHSDLTVTADHGMVIDGLVINASALVNHDTIDFVPMNELEDSLTVYHIETEAHDVILANGSPAETFIDYADRKSFDNYAEYVDLYGAEPIIPEMPMPRISSQRQLPAGLRARLGVGGCDNWTDVA